MIKLNCIFIIFLIIKFFKITNSSCSRLVFVTKLINSNSLKQKPFNYTKIIRVDSVLTEWKCQFLSVIIIRLTTFNTAISFFIMCWSQVIAKSTSVIINNTSTANSIINTTNNTNAITNSTKATTNFITSALIPLTLSLEYLLIPFSLLANKILYLSNISYANKIAEMTRLKIFYSFLDQSK